MDTTVCMRMRMLDGRPHVFIYVYIVSALKIDEQRYRLREYAMHIYRERERESCKHNIVITLYLNTLIFIYINNLFDREHRHHYYHHQHQTQQISTSSRTKWVNIFTSIKWCMYACLLACGYSLLYTEP